MITLVQKAVRYAVGGSSSDQLQDTVSCRPKLQDFVSTTHSAPETKEFQGLVTSIDSSCIVIDHDVYCDPSDFPSNKKVSLGVNVRGLAQRGGKHEMWRAKTIELVTEDWNDGPHGRKLETSGNKSAASNNASISSKDLSEGIPGIFKSDLLSSVSSRSYQQEHRADCSEALPKTTASKTVIGKVTGIYGDAVTINDSICCNLTSSRCIMDLVPGDWIVCDLDGSSSVGDEDSQLHGSIQVSSWKPLRRKRVRGEVTHAYHTHFIVNEEIFCSRSISGASLGQLGDTMTVEVIESQQGSMCWRAITVASAATAPSTQDPGTSAVVLPLGVLPKTDLGKDRIQKMLEDKGDIMITKTIRFPLVTFGVAASTDVSIQNSGLTPRTLKRVYFVYASQESQFSVASYPAGVMDGTARTLEPGAEVMVRLCCAGTLIGSFRQLCVFEFEEFQIGRHVSVTVEDPVMASLAPVSFHTPRPQHRPLAMPNDKGIIMGQKFFKPSPFVPVKLPGVRVPEKLWHEVNQGDLFHVSQVLREPLNADNHKQKFSLLLHLEEIKMIQQMRKYDMARASFTMCGEFLSLTVPGLAEKRPSLMIGDTVVATDLCSSEDIEYEGCIHQVFNSQILLKFHPSFHDGYHGEDYKVRFNFNRTPLRRCHFALDYTMKQLGEDVLFPFRLKLQLPQVCYIDPEIHELTSRWKQHSRSHLLPPEVRDTNEPLTNAPECELQSSSPRLTTLTRVLGGPPQDSDSLSRCNDSEVRVPSIGSEVDAADGTKDACLSKDKNAPASLVNTTIQSPKQDPRYVSFINRCSRSSLKDNSVSQETESDNTDKGADFSKQINEKEEAKQPLSQHKNSQQECSKLRDSHQKGKIYNVNSPYGNLIPRTLDLALCRSANKAKILGNDNKMFEGVNTLKNEKPVVKKCISDSMQENHHTKNDKKNMSSDAANSCKWMKEKHIVNEVYGNEQYKNSKLQPSQKFGCNDVHTKVKNKSCYVIPVLPFGHSRKKTKDLEKVPVLKWFNKSLNQEQKLAVRRILEGSTRPLPYVIFGPPGTGKTVTLVEAALQILTLIHHSRLLLVTPSNSASDLVTERLVESGQLGTSDMVRLIAYQRLKESIPEVIRPYCCNGEELEVRSHQRVVVATATCAGTLYMHGLHREHFTHVLVDEASQLTEPETMVPLGLVNKVKGQIILAGDPKQLGPVIQSEFAKRGGLQQSLLQRLCQTVLYQAHERSELSAWQYEPSLVTQLVKNYRSHPHILAVPSRLFYNNTLQACAEVKVMEHLLSWKELPCNSCPILFHGVVGTNYQEGDSPSWFNPAEAFQVVRYTKSLLLHGVEERNIGIITPYRKQIEKLHRLLSTFGIEGVKVGSVEEFQGQERMVILISTVRSSSGGIEEDAKYSLGFIRCCKRFNVAVTRAQGLLVMVGNPLLLTLDHSWKEMIQYCIKHGAYRGPELEDI